MKIIMITSVTLQLQATHFTEAPRKSWTGSDERRNILQYVWLAQMYSQNENACQTNEEDQRK